MGRYLTLFYQELVAYSNHTMTQLLGFPLLRWRKRARVAAMTAMPSTTPSLSEVVETSWYIALHEVVWFPRMQKV